MDSPVSLQTRTAIDQKEKSHRLALVYRTILDWDSPGDKKTEPAAGDLGRDTVAGSGKRTPANADDESLYHLFQKDILNLSSLSKEEVVSTGGNWEGES